MPAVWFLVQATQGGHEYTHYVCRYPRSAERLASLLAERRPHLQPVRVERHAPTAEQLARPVRFADHSDGPAA